MTSAISIEGLGRRYGDQSALSDVSLAVATNSITGLLGRNGAGKTTLLRLIAGHEFASSGSVKVLGADPTTSDEVLRRMVFIREDQSYPPQLRVRHALLVASLLYPHWDGALASSLCVDFKLSQGKRIKRLSRGMRSALGIVIGLAARADVTLFDEPYAGLDPVARQIFYDRLLSEFADQPRTIVLSTHLIDEAAGLFDRVVVLDEGRVVMNAEADELRGSSTSVSGPVRSVEEIAHGHTVLSRRALGALETVVIAGALDGDERARASALHLTLAPQTLQEVVVQAARSENIETSERTPS